MKVLVVEDRQEKASKIAAALIECGVERDNITVVIDASAAKRAMRTEYFQLAVIDIIIPWQVDGPLLKDGGVRLAVDVFNDEDTRCPVHMLGLTEYDDACAATDNSLPRSVFSVQRYDPLSDEWARALRLRVRQIRDSGLGATTVIVNHDLAVICALDDPELSSVLRLDWGWHETIVRGDPTIYHVGEIPGEPKRRVVAAATAAMGLTAAAVGTTKIISTFRPRFVAMVGIAAGVPERVNLGDVIVGNPIWDWGSGKWTSQRGVLRFHAAPNQLDVEPQLRNLCRRLSSDTEELARIKAAFPGDRPTSELRLHVGPMASGAAVLADGQTVALILEQHRNLLGVDMEAYAVLASALEATIPRPSAFVIKGVVDFANGKKSDKFQRYAANSSAQVLEVLARRYLFA